MERFSNKVTKILQDGGWSENRVVDTGKFEEALKKEGFQVFPSVINFLKGFGGLRFNDPGAEPPAVSNFHFVAEESAGGQAPYVKKHYSSVLGAELCVVGEAADNYMLLMMDERGRFFAGYEDEFMYLGDSVVEAIEALCDQRELPSVKDYLARTRRV